MKIIFVLMLGLMTSQLTYARDVVRTTQIDGWGYTQDHLVLYLNDGERVLVVPEQCSIEKFNEQMISGSDLSLKISSNRVRRGVPFDIIDQESSGQEILRCKVAGLVS